MIISVVKTGNLGSPFWPLAAGLLTILTINTRAAVLCVDVNGTNAKVPYSDWSTAATNIQDAADIAVAGDLIMVTNGVYRAGGNLAFGRVYVRSSIIMQSVNGADVTTIDGAGVMRCALLDSSAQLLGFTLANGAALNHSGGGVSCLSPDAVVVDCIFTNNSGVAGGGAQTGTYSNCTFISNIATNYGGGVYGGTIYQCSFVSNTAGAYGGGAYSSTLNYCTLTANSATSGGGGAYSSILNNCTLKANSADSGGGACYGTLNNCTLITNSATYGGGAYSSRLNNCMLMANSAYDSGGAFFSILNNCSLTENAASWNGGGANGGTLNNCIIYFNSAPNDPNFSQDEDGGVLNYCCTIPLPTHGANNFTNSPQFVDWAGGNLRLQSTSPCINSGNNAYVTQSTDIDGNPRNVRGTVDIGAYEFQSPTSLMSYAWLQRYGLPTDGTADYAHADTDGLNNWQEWISGTDPTNNLSVLQMLAPRNNGLGISITWLSAPNRMYFLQRASNLDAQVVFSTVQSNIAGQAGSTTYTDLTPTNSGAYFYRVGVQQ